MQGKLERCDSRVTASTLVSCSPGTDAVAQPR